MKNSNEKYFNKLANTVNNDDPMLMTTLNSDEYKKKFYRLINNKKRNRLILMMIYIKDKILSFFSGIKKSIVGNINMRDYKKSYFSRAYVWLFGLKLSVVEKYYEKIKYQAYYRTDVKYVKYVNIDNIYVRIKKSISKFYSKIINNLKTVEIKISPIDVYMNETSLKYRKSRIYKNSLVSKTDKNLNNFWDIRDEFA